MARPSAVFVLQLACLLVAATVCAKSPKKLTPPPWVVFLDTVRETAAKTIASTPRQLNYQDTAAAIVRALNDMVDPKTRKQGNNFGILYCAAVWSGGAPLPFHDIIIPGGKRKQSQVKTMHLLRNGIYPNADCWYNNRPVENRERNQEFGDFGWPCKDGGSTGFTQATSDGYVRRCMVFISPESHDPSQVGSRLTAFRDALADVKRQTPRLQSPYGSIPLADVVEVFELAYVKARQSGIPENQRHAPGSSAYNRYRSKGSAIIPVASAADFGMAAGNGHVTDDSIEVPLSIDLNTHDTDHQLRLRFIALLI